MFSKLFGKTEMSHPQYGRMRHRRSIWRGTEAILFGSDLLTLLIPGDVDGPEGAAIDLLTKMEASYPRLRSEMAAKLYQEHYINAKETETAEQIHLEAHWPERDEMGSEDYVDEYAFPEIASADNIWEFASVTGVRFEPRRNSHNKGHQQILLSVIADWYDDHTLGFMFENGEICEFNTSIRPF